VDIAMGADRPGTRHAQHTAERQPVFVFLRVRCGRNREQRSASRNARLARPARRWHIAGMHEHAPNSSRQIWVDADACPNVIKEILFRAAERVRMPLTLVANQPIQVPGSRYVRSVRVAAGFDVADNYIVQKAEPGDLVVTADIPLAAEVIDKGCLALNPRGELYTRENIRQRLNMRDFLDTLRSSGVDTGGPPAFSKADRQAFANQLDRLLAA
jgi:uncharacterized protein